MGREGRAWRRAERQAGYVVPSTSASSALPYITITISPNVLCEWQQHIIKNLRIEKDEVKEGEEERNAANTNLEVA